MPNSCDMTNRIVIGGKHFLHAWRCSARAACAWPVARPSRWTVARKLTAQRAVMLTVSWTQHTVRTGLCQLDAAGGCLDGRPVFIYAVFKDAVIIYRGAGCWYVLSPIRKETSSEACQGRARFQHRDTSWHQVFFSLQGKVPKEIHAILTEMLACFLPGRDKDLSAPL